MSSRRRITEGQKDIRSFLKKEDVSKKTSCSVISVLKYSCIIIKKSKKVLEDSICMNTVVLPSGLVNCCGPP